MPNFEIINVSKVYPNGRIDGSLVEGCCACTLEEAVVRAQYYADKSRNGARYAVIHGSSAWDPMGRDYYDHESLCGVLTAPDQRTREANQLC